MSSGSKIRVELEMSELVASYTFETQRGLVDREGARGIWDQFGGLRVVVNGHPVAALQMHEDSQGRMVLTFTQLRDEHAPVGLPTVIELERLGFVPGRTERKK